MKKIPGYYRNKLKKALLQEKIDLNIKNPSLLKEQGAPFDQGYCLNTPGVNPNTTECQNCATVHFEWCPDMGNGLIFPDDVLSPYHASIANQSSYHACVTINGERPDESHIGQTVLLPYAGVGFDGLQSPIYGVIATYYPTLYALWVTITAISPTCNNPDFGGASCNNMGNITFAVNGCLEQPVEPPPRYTCTSCNGCQEDPNGPFFTLDDCEESNCVTAADYNFPVILPADPSGIPQSFESLEIWCGRCLGAFTQSQALHTQFPDLLPNCNCCEGGMSVTPPTPEPEPEPDTVPEPTSTFPEKPFDKKPKPFDKTSPEIAQMQKVAGITPEEKPKK